MQLLRGSNSKASTILLLLMHTLGGSNSRIPQTLAFMEIILIQGEHLLLEILCLKLEHGPGITLLIS
jgi:hypothetical protein